MTYCARSRPSSSDGATVLLFLMRVAWLAWVKERHLRRHAAQKPSVTPAVCGSQTAANKGNYLFDGPSPRGGMLPRMDTTTLLIIVVLILLLGGGGFFYRRR